MFQRIIIPLDGSKLAEHALSVGARIGRSSGASLILFRAVNSPDDAIYSYKGSPINLARIFEQDRVEAHSYLERIAKGSDLAGIEVITRVADGNPAQAILSEAQASNADLIVMCSHGDTGLKRWMLGSVSLHVARHSIVPVFMLRSAANGAVTFPQMATGQVRIMVPLDGSILAEEILTPAIALAQTLSAPLPGALHLASVIPFFTAESTDALDEVMKAAQEYLVSVEQQLLQRIDTAKLTITSSLTVLADVAHALVELAETGKGVGQIESFTGCNVIAMSTHGRNGILHWMMGSVTERVLASTKLPMLIVRPQQIRAKQQKALEEKNTDGKSANDETEFPSWIGLL